MQLILNMKILLRQEVKPVSDPSPFRIKVSVPCWILQTQSCTFKTMHQKFKISTKDSANRHLESSLVKNYCSNSFKVVWLN